jgi:hypothetical protein
VAVEDGASDDGALDADLRERLEIGLRPDAARGEDRRLGTRDDLLEQAEIGAAERAVAFDGGAEDAGDAGLRAASGGRFGVEQCLARPTGDGDPTRSHVDRDHEAVAECADVWLERAVSERGRFDDDPRGTGSDQLLRLRRGTDTAHRLDGDRRGGRDNTRDELWTRRGSRRRSPVQGKRTGSSASSRTEFHSYFLLAARGLDPAAVERELRARHRGREALAGGRDRAADVAGAG